MELYVDDAEENKMSWNVWKDGKQLGPFSESEMAAFLRKNTLSASDKVFGPTMKSWTSPTDAREELERLGSVPEDSVEPLVIAAAVAETVRSVRVIDIDMPFGSMVAFMVKWSLASIPAFIILGVIFAFVFWLVGAALR